MDDLVLSVAALEARFRSGSARIGIIGLGYIGLPLVEAIAGRGHVVVGFDIDSAKIEALEAGRSYIRHVDGARLAELREQGCFEVTTDFSLLGSMDAILICVPTPLTRQREPDLSFVAQTTRAVAATLRPGQLIVLESTSYPGTVAEVIRPILEAGGLHSGRDFFLAYSPEREDPGNAEFGTAAIPKVVGGDGPEAQRLALALYGGVVVRTVPVSSVETAEAVKLTENIFRAVNIALVNELKLVFDAMGIDVWEVIEAAKTKPFGYMPFYPGPGLGGHCIPIDPFYLTWKAREFGISTRFVELAGEVNTAMPRYVLTRLGEALDQTHRRGFNGSRILVLGVAYKKNVDDVRESPALSLIELIESRGAIVDFYDPFVPQLPPMREHATLHGKCGVSWDKVLDGGYHAALIVTDHDDIDYAALVDAIPLVVDTRNACHRAGVHRTHIVKA
jgi:UDP-N-acetyl-D-glucosamine dehydrogenase